MAEKALKIAICSDNNNEYSKASNRFARCEYFTVYNHNNLSFDFVENSAKNEMSGAGSNAGKIVADLDIDIVLVPEIGPKAFVALEAFGIEIYQYKGDITVRDAIYLLFEGKLSKVNAPSKKGKH